MNVLLIVPNFYQAIGIMAQRIVEACPEINFYCFRGCDIQSRNHDFEQLYKSVDVVHWLSNISQLNSQNDFILPKIDCPSVSTIHHISPGENKLLHSITYCDVVHVVSSEWKNAIQELTDIPVCLAHQPVNHARFFKGNFRTGIHKPFRIGTFGFASSLSDRKRIDVLLSSLVKVKKANIDFHLVVQGKHWDKIIPYFTDERINVINLGFTTADSAWKAYKEIDLYVCSSDVEGGPMTVIEALASGIPVVSTDVGVSIELLKHGGGILVNKNDPENLAKAIELMITEPDYYKKQKEYTQKAISILERSIVYGEYRQMYEKVISEYEDKQQKSWQRKNNLPIKPELQRMAERDHEKINHFFVNNFHIYKHKRLTAKVISKLFYNHK